MDASFSIRLATRDDIPQMDTLIPSSSFKLQSEFYQPGQIKAALGPVFGVDEQLIEDGTYFVATIDCKIVGCGGWSFRLSQFGGSHGRKRPTTRLDPKTDAAKIRAFFVDPAFARKGIGTALMNACESAIVREGFSRIEITATLAGEKLYTRFGYRLIERMSIPLENEAPLPAVRLFKEISSLSIES